MVESDEDMLTRFIMWRDRNPDYYEKFESLTIGLVAAGSKKNINKELIVGILRKQKNGNFSINNNIGTYLTVLFNIRNPKMRGIFREHSGVKGGDELAEIENCERYDGLKECRTYCNETQIMPAMVHYVERQSLSIRAASRAVAADTGGAVTASRALMVYHHRKGVSNETDKPERDPEPVVSDGPEPGWIRQTRDLFYFAVMSEALSIERRNEATIKKLIVEQSKKSGIPTTVLLRWFEKQRDEIEKRQGAQDETKNDQPTT